MRFTWIAASLAVVAVSTPVFAQTGLEFVSYGELDWRDNNFAAATGAGPSGVENYQTHLAGTSFNRFLLGDHSEPTRIRPYIEVDGAASSRDVTQENTVTGSIGAEVRPFAWMTSRKYDWFRYARVYAQYSYQGFLRSSNPAWNPRNDFQAGSDLWTLFGAAKPSDAAAGQRQWSELFLGGAFHTTQFYLENHNVVHAGADIRTGTTLGDTRAGKRLMPYIVLDGNFESDSYYWENRIWGGVGVRKEFYNQNDHRLWVYAEPRWIISYPKGAPPVSDSVPSHDVVVGLAYSYDLYTGGF